MSAKKKTRSRRTGSGAERELPPGVKLLRTLEGHKGKVRSVAFDPQGGTLASGSDDKTVKLWEARTGKLLRTLEGHKEAVTTVAFDPQGGTFASGSMDNTVKLWEARSGKLLRTLDVASCTVWSVAFDPQGGMLASGSAVETVKLWDTRSGKLLRTLEEHPRSSSSVAFDPQGKTLASGGKDNKVKLSEARSGKLLRTLEGHQNMVNCVTFDPQGATLASGSADNTVALWEARSGKLLRTLEGHTREVHPVAFCPDGRLLASKSSDGTIRLWSCETWETVAVIKEPTVSVVRALAFHPTLPLLACAGSEPDTSDSERSRLIHLWELDFDVLLGKRAGVAAAARADGHYRNAKVVLVGNTSVGKSGLGLVLAGRKSGPLNRPTAGISGRWTNMNGSPLPGPNAVAEAPATWKPERRSSGTWQGSLAIGSCTNCTLARSPSLSCFSTRAAKPSRSPASRIGRGRWTRPDTTASP